MTKPDILKILIITVSAITLSCWAEFVIKPMTYGIPASNGIARFYCQYEREDDNIIIGWRVNNRSLNDFSDDDIHTISSPLPYLARLHTLVLPATTNYNRSYIHCVAVMINEDGSSIPEYSQPPAYFYITQDRGNTPSIPTGFFKQPIFYDSKYILAEREEAVVSCQHCDTDTINWIINGQKLTYVMSDGQITPDRMGINITYSVQPLCGLTVNLMIKDLLVYNRTSVQCIAGRSRNIVAMTQPFELLVQGELGAVSNLTRSQIGQGNVTYIWTPPFSLNLTNSDPDIVYCVKIDPAHCKMNALTPAVNVCDAHQQCSITEPTYTLPNCEITDDVLNHIQVVPRSNVERANNGTPGNHTDKFQFFDNMDVTYMISITSQQSVLIKISLDQQNYRNQVQPVNIMLNLTTISSSSQETFQCTTESENTLPSHTERYRSLDVLECSSQTVQEAAGLYMANVYVPNMECPASNQTELSTHVLQNVRVNTSSVRGEIMVSGDFIDGDLPNDVTATGFMAIAYTVNSTGNIERHYGIARRIVGQQHVEARISGLPRSNYRVSVFSSEHNGLPLNKSATTAKNVSIMTPFNNVNLTDDTDPESSITVTAALSSTNDCQGVRLDCIFNEPANNDDQCVAIILEHSQLLSKYGLLELSIYMLNRSENVTIASVCLPQGINYSAVFIDVFLFRDNTISSVPRTIREIHEPPDITDSPPNNVVPIVVGVLGALLVTAAVAIIIIAVLLYKTKRCDKKRVRQPDSPERIEMNKSIATLNDE